MKRAIYFGLICILLFTFSLSGCKDSGFKETPPMNESEALTIDEVLAETEEHRVFRCGDKYYIEYSKVPEIESNGLEVFGDASASFFNLDHLKNSILNNTVNKSKIRDFLYRQNSETDKTLRIFNIEKMYDGVYPDEYALDYVSWYGNEAYYLKLVPCLDGAPPYHITITYYEPWLFEETYNENYIERISELEKNYTVTQLPEMNATQYTDDLYKYIIYSFEYSGKTISAIEYYLTYNIGSSEEKMVFDSVRLYVPGDEVNYTLTFSGTQRPSIEWMMSFGMKPHVPVDVPNHWPHQDD